jgi:hypothetical protein
MNKTLLWIVAPVVVVLTSIVLWQNWPIDEFTLPAYEATSSSQVSTKTKALTAHYIEVVDSCDSAFSLKSCVNLRLGIGKESPIFVRLRTGVVLRVESTTTMQDGY